MANYSDLNTLFQNGMGSFAALQAGQQSAYDEQVRALEAQKLQEAINQQKQMNPLDLMFKQAQIENEQATAANTRAVGQNNQVTANINQQTAPQQIAAKLSGLTAQMSEDDIKQMGNDGQKALGAAKMLEGIPAMARPAALSKILEKYNVDTENPMIKPILNGDPNNMVQSLTNLGQGLSLASSDYIKNKALQESKQAFESGQNELDRKNRTSIAAGNNAATLGAARIAADSRIQVAQAAADARKNAIKHMNMDQRITFLSGIPKDQRTPDEQEQLEQLSKQQLAARGAGVNPLAAQLLNKDNAGQVASQNSPFVDGGTSAPAIDPTVQVQQALKAAGQAYEPDKYIYRLGPNGQVQRKAR